MTDISDTLAERGARYGDFTDHAIIAQTLQDDMRKTTGWERLSSDKKQALTVIADKIARILSGDPDYRDNWHDVQGYAKLAEERCIDRSQPQLPLEQDGWIEWNGGDCPVPSYISVFYTTRGGRTGGPTLSRWLNWSHGGKFLPTQIVRYRLAGVSE